MIIRFLAVLLNMISINLMAINYVDQADNLLKQSNCDSSIYYYDLALKNCQNNCHDIKDFRNSLKYCDKALVLIEKTEWYGLKKYFNYYKYREHYNLKQYKQAIEPLDICRKYTE